MATPIEAARGRRITRAVANKARLDILVDNIHNEIELPLKKRAMIAVEYLKTTIIRNISKSVGRATNQAGHVYITERSLPGEFPRAETTQLLKTIFSEFAEVRPGVYEGFVGTPLNYGLILETSLKLDRRFLSRTLEEEYDTIVEIIVGRKK